MISFTCSVVRRRRKFFFSQRKHPRETSDVLLFVQGRKKTLVDAAVVAVLSVTALFASTIVTSTSSKRFSNVVQAIFYRLMVAQSQRMRSHQDQPNRCLEVRFLPYVCCYDG